MSLLEINNVIMITLTMKAYINHNKVILIYIIRSLSMTSKIVNLIIYNFKLFNNIKYI